MAHLDDMLENQTVALVRVLEQIRREGPIAQVDLGKSLGLGRAAVNVHVKKLLAQRIVIPVGSQEGGMGRPRILLDLDRSGKAVLGISLDTPYLSAALMDFSNQIIVRRTIPVGSVSSVTELSEAILSLVRELQDEASKRDLELFSACFAVPGVMEPGTGRIVNYVNMPAANGLDIKKVLGVLLDIPVYVVPLTAAIYWAGLEPEQADQPVFHVTWDLGVGLMFGRGYEIGFKQYRKRDVMAVTGGIRDVGHTPIRPDGRLCRCGRRGCMEAYFGGWAMVESWNARHPEKPVTFAQLLELASAGHPQVVSMLTRQARRLGETLAWIFALHMPGSVKLSGQIPDAAPFVCDIFWQAARRRMGDNNVTSFSYLSDVRSLGLEGSCRLALHVRFNKPLLEIVSDDEVRVTRRAMRLAGAASVAELI